jgi:TolA-binding protein
MRLAVLLIASSLASPAAAQVLVGDPLRSLSIQNEQRYLESQIRALQARTGRLETQQSLQRLEQQRGPSDLAGMRQLQLDAVEAQQTLRAHQAASTARAARLRGQSSLGALGYADGLPLAPRQ